MQNKFYFYKGEKQDEFSLKINNAKQKALLLFQSGKDFEVVVQDIQEKRSPKQLRGFWRLIDCIRDTLEERGHFFFSDEIKDLMLEKAGHVKVIEGIKIVRSINGKSDTTKEEMKNIIESILNYAIEKGIHNCYLEEREKVELINYYKE
jgi:hypothetical protein